MFALTLGVASVVTPVWGQQAASATSAGNTSKDAAKTKGGPIWEYQPYKAQVWISFDPALPITDLTMSQFVAEMEKDLDHTFGGTFETSISGTPRFLDQLVFQDFSRLNPEKLLESELVLAISSEVPGSNTMRSLESAIQKLPKFPVDALRAQEISQELKALKDDPLFSKINEKLEVVPGNSDSMVKSLLAKELQVGIVSKFEFNKLGKGFRQVTIRFPWQVDSMLRRQDKIFFVRISRKTELLVAEVRELDCPAQVMGATYEGESTSWQNLSRMACSALTKAFVPIARIEDVNDKIVSMRVRAGGLINYEGHPVALYPGDVLRPMLPRTDKSAPGAAQSIPWTYVAATYGDSIQLGGVVFSATSKNPLGNPKKKMMRTALRVQVPYDHTEMQLMMKPFHIDKKTAPPPSISAPGMAVFQRVPSQKISELVGRTDWRGIYAITNTELPEIEYDLPVTEQAQPPAAAPTATVDPNAPATDANAAQPAAEPPPPPKGKVKLRAPLMLYFVQNGDTVLAKLPIVNGMTKREVAELTDDSRRLEAEAFVKGLQNQIVETVARRRLLSTMIKKRVDESNGEKANDLLNNLRATRTYDSLSQTLDAYERRVLAPEKGLIPLVTERRITSLFNTTRSMLQKYMQDNLVAEMQKLVSEKFPPSEAEPAVEAPANAAETK